MSRLIATLYREPVAVDPSKAEGAMSKERPGPYSYGEAQASVVQDISTENQEVVQDRLTPTLILGAGTILGYYMAGSLANTLSMKIGGAIAGFLAGNYIQNNLL